MRALGGTAAIVATSCMLIVAAAIACSTELALNDRQDPNAEGGAEGGGGDPDASGSPDAEPDVEDLGPPISADASLDGAAPDGCTPDAGTLPAGCDRVVFVTSTRVPRSEVAMGDAKCTELASRANALPRIKGRIFQAWATDAFGIAPASRFLHATGKYIRPNGDVIADDWADLTDADLDRPIVHNEAGGTASSAYYAWTGTATNGMAGGGNCTDWTVSTGTARGGDIGRTGSTWTALFMEISCSLDHYLFCFEK